jgi:hypothetical protein
VTTVRLLEVGWVMVDVVPVVPLTSVDVAALAAGATAVARAPAATRLTTRFRMLDMSWCSFQGSTPGTVGVI